MPALRLTQSPASKKPSKDVRRPRLQARPWPQSPRGVGLEKPQDSRALKGEDLKGEDEVW